MTDYISREELIEEIEEEIEAGDETLDEDVWINRGLRIAIKDIRKHETADVQPVRHGRWFPSGRDNDYNSYLRCSRCEHEIVMYRDSEKKPPNYCENCGARMDGEQNDV